METYSNKKQRFVVQLFDTPMSNIVLGEVYIAKSHFGYLFSRGGSPHSLLSLVVFISNSLDLIDTEIR